eukprot:178351_1
MSVSKLKSKYKIPSEMLQSAKEKMMQLLDKNLHSRCNKVIRTLNQTTKHSNKTCALLKKFELNEGVTERILENISSRLIDWEGGNYAKKIQNDNKCFQKIRAHWNRMKAQQLGNELFVVVLSNLFKIIVEIQELSQQEQITFYIDLFYDLSKEKIQFEQSMARPVIPIACFDKANKFRRFCQNILESFGGDEVKWNSIKTTRSVRGNNGTTVTKYIKNANRAQILADSYYECLKTTKCNILQSSNEFIQHSIQGHLQWINKTCDDMLVLITWAPIQPITKPINNINNNINNDTNSVPDSISKGSAYTQPNNPIIENNTEQLISGTATLTTYPNENSEHFYSNLQNTNTNYFPMQSFTNTSSNNAENHFMNANQCNAANTETQHQCTCNHQSQYPTTCCTVDMNNNIYPMFTPINTNNMYIHNTDPPNTCLQNAYTQNLYCQNGYVSTPRRHFQSNNNFLNPSNRIHIINRGNTPNILTQRRELYFDSMRQSFQQTNFPQ